MADADDRVKESEAWADEHRRALPPTEKSFTVAFYDTDGKPQHQTVTCRPSQVADLLSELGIELAFTTPYGRAFWDDTTQTIRVVGNNRVLEDLARQEHSSTTPPWQS